MSEVNRRIVLAARPSGLPKPADFRLEETAIPQPQNGEVLLRIQHLSLDPYMRGRMNDAKSYAKPTAIGQEMEGGTVATVLESRAADFKPGDVVLSYSGWQSHAVAKPAELRKLDPTAAPVTTALGVLGMPGFTAYAGLPVGQVAKIKGARAVGIAGGPEKCAFVLNELGFDASLDHSAADFPAQLAAACPKGIDVYFENVGGHVWDAVFPLLNDFSRIPVCGLIAQYNDGDSFPGPDRFPVVMREVLSKRLNIRGFIQRDFAEQRPDFYKDMAQWIREGRVKYREDIVDGLENAPQAFVGMLKGKNFGKLIVRVSGN